MKSAITILIVGMMLFAACGNTTIVDNPPNQEGSKTDFTQGQGLQKFSNAAEVTEFLNEMQSSNYNYYSSRSFSFGMTDGVMMESDDFAAAPMAQASGAKSSGASEYSTTNVQVENVDEADFIKNDDKFIYQLQDDELIIIDAYPADDAEIVSRTKLDGRARSMFLNEDKLIVFTYEDDRVNVFYEYNYFPSSRYISLTKATIYDISNREDVEEIEQYTIKGDFFQARMIGDYVYFITKENVFYNYDFVDMPIIRSESGASIMPDVYYFPNPEDDYLFHTVASININNEEIKASSYLMGYSNNLYMSEDNMYVSYQKRFPRNYYEEENKERFFEVVVPILPFEYSNRINKYKNQETDYSWMKVSEILQEMFEEVDESELENIYQEIEEKVREYNIKVSSEKQKTIIQKLSVNEGKIDFVATGEVKGMLNNQFSLDEHEGNLRVATTLNVWARSGSVTYNNVYVLNENMKQIGELEEIAPDESIYSTRFIGDRLYMVTFQRIDPLFVIDLSNPRNPEILGELKIPGFSDYLHPYDENHIIGIGKETEGNEWGGVSIKGVKLSLFDVSDVNNPKQIDTYQIGGRGTDSEALYEHKAFLFDKEKNILVIPIREVDYDTPDIAKSGYYRRYNVWQGAYAFGLTPKEGFELKGKISHESIFEQDYYWYRSPYAVRRSLYMDDVLYTISEAKIVMNDIDTIKKINEVDLDYNEDDVVYPVYY